MLNNIKPLIISIILLISASGQTTVKGGLTAIDDQFTIPENHTPAATIFVLSNDLSVSKSTIIVSVTQPENATVILSSNNISYLPDTDYCNSNSGNTDDFTYSISDNPPSIASMATVQVTVTCSDILIQAPQTVPSTNGYSLIIMMVLLLCFVSRNRNVI